MTNRELAELANVPASLIAGLQSGKRRVGEQNARQIAGALNLRGEALDEFIFSAIDTSTEKTLEHVKAYPSQLINHGGLTLSNAGVFAEQVTTCNACKVTNGQMLSLSLIDGRRAILKTTLLIT